MATNKRFGTFEGVFTPGLLSILGVIMYLRLGFVVGSVGLTGTIIIIVLANVITISTALSMSSVVTNIRIGAGGAYSIISKSLGVEAGGAIGVPLYIAQAISVAFYITGFGECWRFIFPEHDTLLVSLIAWFGLFIIAYFSAKFAFRVQFLIMAIIVASIIAMIIGNPSFESRPVEWQYFPVENFWSAFAIFFPAVTGILAGASMSGELINPRESIPKGTLWSIGVSFIIYIVLAYLFASRVPLEELKANNDIAITMGRWSWVVIAGILGATISSAISMFVSSPRILLALSKHSLMPCSVSFSRVNSKGEPSAAILLTALVALVTILFGSLDQIAGLLTMFFLITYGMINFTVFTEQSIGIASFRPTFKISRWVTFAGSIGCLAMMFLIDFRFSVIAFLSIIAIYFILIKKGVSTYSPDIRSGMLLFIAERMANAASYLPYYPKIWKPNLLLPIRQKEQLESVSGFVRNIIFPAGRLVAVQVCESKLLKKVELVEAQSEEEKTRAKSSLDVVSEQLTSTLHNLKQDGIFVETAAVHHDDFVEGTKTVIQTLKGVIFPPNALFYILEEDTKNDHIAKEVIEQSSEEGLGIIVMAYNPKVGFAQEQIVNLWIRKQSPNINLSILVALQLEKNWGGVVRLIQVVNSDEERKEAQVYLTKLKDVMRLPLDVEIEILVGEFKQVANEAPPADINIFGMPDRPDIATIRDVEKSVKTSILFLRDSKHESALA